MAQNQTIHTVKIKGTEDLIRLRGEIDNYERSLKKLKAQTKNNKETTDRQIQGLEHLERNLKRVRKEYRDGQKALEGLNRATKSSGSFTMKMAKAFGVAQIATQLFTRAMQAVGQAVKQAITTFKDFEFQMAKVKAISGASEKEFKKLNNSAKELGRTTFFTASQVGELQLNLSKLGFNPQEILESQEAILMLSTAMGEDLGRTATVVAATLRGFGESTDQTARFADGMAAAFSNSALDIEKFQTSMSKVSAIAAMAGFSFEETSGLLALLTNSGMEASIAGTSLRNILLHLQDPTSDLTKRLGRTVSSGDDLIVALKELQDSGINVAGVMGIVQRRQVQAMNSFIKGADTLSDFNKLMEESSGKGKEMADVMENTLGGALLKLKSAWEGFTLTLTEGDFGNWLKDFVNDNVFLLNHWAKHFGTAEQNAVSIISQANRDVKATLKDQEKALEQFKENEREIYRQSTSQIMKDELEQMKQRQKFLASELESEKKSSMLWYLTTDTKAVKQAQKNLDAQGIAIKEFSELIIQQQEKEKNAAKEKEKQDRINAELQAAEAEKQSSLIVIQEDLLKQAKEMPEVTEQQLVAKNRLIKKIEDEIKRLKELGVERKKEKKELTDAQKADIELNQILNNEKLRFAEGEIETKKMLNESLLQLTIDHMQKTLDTATLSADERLRLETKLANQKAKLRESDLVATAESEKAKSELIKANIDNAMTIGNSLTQIGQIMGENSAAAKAGIAITKAAAVANAINGIIAAKGAIADQADKGDPYTAFARMAMMAAAVAPLIASLVALKGEAGGGSESSGGMKHGSGSQVASGGQYARGGLTRGGMFEGASHAHGGVKFAVGGRIHEAEGGEAIINKRSTAAFRPILSAINSYNGNGVKFADGGLISSGEKFAMGGQLRSVQQIVSGGMGSAKVVMVESDVTSTQNRVNALEAQASF